MSQPQPGGVVAGRFVLETEIGSGSSGAVYRATDQKTGELIALKILHQEGDSETESRFFREARTASALEHASAIRVIDWGNDGGRLFLAMELLTGETLDNRLQREPPLSRERMVAVAAEVARVLAAAHAIDLIHRDIKPANIWIAEDEAITVLDFGLAFIAVNDGSLGRLTQEGVLGGTPAYMSPEQALADPIGAPSDVYALGSVLFEMFSGRPPFIGSIADVLARKIYLAPRRLAELCEGECAEISDLVGEMLAKEPEQRPTAAQVVERLEQLTAS